MLVSSEIRKPFLDSFLVYGSNSNNLRSGVENQATTELSQVYTWHQYLHTKLEKLRPRFTQ